MLGFMRILVHLTDDLANALAAHCAAKGITQAEAVIDSGVLIDFFNGLRSYDPPRRR
jgi:hypothetical protein